MPDIGSILRDMHVPWPEADENVLREAAAAWYRLEDALKDGCGRANSAAGSLTSNNEGAAVDAFQEYWNKYGDRRSGALPLAAEACHEMGNACVKYADAVVATKHKIEEAGAELGATLTIGTIGAFFTFGATEGAADGISALILDAASNAIAALGATVAAIAEELSAGAVAAAVTAATDAVATSLVTYGATSALSTGATVLANGALAGAGGAVFADSATNAVRKLYGDKPLSSAEEVADVLDGLRDGAVGGVLGKISELGQAQLAALLRNTARTVSDTDLQLSMQMTALASHVEGMTGKITKDVMTKAATQLVTVQQLNADKIAEGEIPKVIKHAATRNEG